MDNKIKDGSSLEGKEQEVEQQENTGLESLFYLVGILMLMLFLCTIPAFATYMNIYMRVEGSGGGKWLLFIPYCLPLATYCISMLPSMKMLREAMFVINGSALIYAIEYAVLHMIGGPFCV